MSKAEFDVRLNLNINNLSQKLKSNIKLVQKVLDAQVLKDSDYFAPHDTGTLIKSGTVGTVLGSGKIRWTVAYAHDQYYNYPKKRLIHNPNARMKWFEEAKAIHLNDWSKLVNDTFNRLSK